LPQIAAPFERLLIRTGQGDLATGLWRFGACTIGGWKVIEIFKSSPGQDGAPERFVGTELPLTQPADVFFGSASPGIAFYEKIGPDLNITLLDGTDVVIKNFFVIGPDGSYSRLLVGAERAEEITGLVAPEPIAFSTDTPRQVEEEQLPQQATETVIAEGDTDLDVAPMDVVEIGWTEGDGFEVSEVEGESLSGQASISSDSGFMGISTDKLAFGAATIAGGSLAFSEWSESDNSAAAVQAARAAAAEAEESAADETEGDPDTTETSEAGEGSDGASGASSIAGLLGGNATAAEAETENDEMAQEADNPEAQSASSGYLGALLGGMGMNEGGEDAELDLLFSDTGGASDGSIKSDMDLAGLLGGGMGAAVSSEMDDPMAILGGLDNLGSWSTE
jgi:hypothetical protein